MVATTNRIAGGTCKQKITADVAIIGGGVAGLLLATKLGDLQLSVVLAEKTDVLAGGPSTRNEGWLHPGTYHAASIQDADAAVRVARRCRYGYEQIRRYAPEAI